MKRTIQRLGQLGRRQAGPVSFCFLIPVRSYSMCPQTNSVLASKLPFPGFLQKMPDMSRKTVPQPGGGLE